MTLETSFANIRIKNNSIDKSSTYAYDKHVDIYGSAIIDGNSFIAPVAYANMLSINNCSCRITNNKFIRGSTTISSYISATGTNDQIITNNIFDRSTIDGTTDGYTIVTGLSANSIYHSNKNQVIYVPIQLGMGTGTDFVTGDGYKSADIIVINQGFYLKINLLRTNAQTYIENINLNAALPDGVRIDEMKMGIYVEPTSDTLAASNTITFYITSMDNVSANYTTGTNSILDAKASFLVSGDLPDFTVETDYSVNSNFAAMQASTQYITISVNNDERFRNTKDRMLTFEIAYNMQLATAPSSLKTYLSPILARCIW